MKITDEKILKQLSHFRDHAKTKQERHRSHAILLSNNGKSVGELSEIFAVSQRTIYNWFKDFKAKSIDSLACQKGRGRKPILNENANKKVIQELIDAYPHQPKKAYALSMEKLSLKMSYKTFKRFLKKHSIIAINE